METCLDYCFITLEEENEEQCYKLFFENSTDFFRFIFRTLIYEMIFYQIIKSILLLIGIILIKVLSYLYMQSKFKMFWIALLRIKRIY